MKATICPTVVSPRMSSQMPNSEHADQGQRRAGPRRNGGDRPPGQHRKLRGQIALAPSRGRRRPRPPCARKICSIGRFGERVGDVGGHRVIVRRRPRPDGVSCRGSRSSSPRRRRRRAPISTRPNRQLTAKRRRQRDEQRDESRAMLAEKGQPKAEHRVRPVEHDLRSAVPNGSLRESSRAGPSDGRRNPPSPPCAGAAPAGRNRTRRDAGQDCEHPEAAPGGGERRDRAPIRRARGPLRGGELVDDAAKQQRLRELRKGDGDVGEDQRQRQGAFGA